MSCYICIYNDTVLCNSAIMYVSPLDYEKVITYYMRQYKYQEALRVLRTKGLEALEAPERVRILPFFSNLLFIYMYIHVYNTVSIRHKI